MNPPQQHKTGAAGQGSDDQADGARAKGRESGRAGGTRGAQQDRSSKAASATRGSQETERCLAAIEENCRTLRQSMGAGRASDESGEGDDAASRSMSGPGESQGGRGKRSGQGGRAQSGGPGRGGDAGRGAAR